MNLTIPRKTLYSALQTVGRIAATASSLPVLRNVLLETTPTGLRLAATDLELSAEIQAVAQIDREGAVTLPARTLLEIVGALPEGDVTLTWEPGATEVALQCGRSAYRIGSLPADEFPSLPEVRPETAFALPQTLLRALIGGVLPCVSSDDTRPILGGVLLRKIGTELLMVATDTHRLARHRVLLPDLVAAPDLEVNIPARALTELLRSLADTETPVAIHADANQVSFRSERVTLVSRLIEGRFPLFERVIPKQHTTLVECDREALAGCARRARIVARECDARDRLVLACDGGFLHLTAQSANGQATEQCAADLGGEPLQIAFNAAYLLDGLAVLGTERAVLECSGPLAPAILRPVDGPDYLMVLMPMQIS